MSKPNAVYKKAYFDAKLLTKKILLNLNFESKANDCVALDAANATLDRCRNLKGFNVERAIKDGNEIDKQVDAIFNEFKKAHNL